MSEQTGNRLADQESPYLQEAKDQPVAWRPWSKQAFEDAREAGKPVLVDSGAVWCHWCHVMDHESYEDPETAELINELFVPVKLDRDERPDVDARLQRGVGAITGRGGWPLTAFLTPDGEVYYGGTYFPPEPQGGMPGFKDVLQRAAGFYQDKREAALEQAEKIQAAIEQAGPTLEAGRPGLGVVEETVATLVSRYDAVHGGFGSAPKFPHPGTHRLLLAWHALGHDGDGAAWEAMAHTLEAMAHGGIHDHLDGGFHRYSVDTRWHVPHFEKMLYDNGPLTHDYAWAAALARAKGETGRADLFEATARDTATFLVDILQLDSDGFGGSQDADRRPEAQGPLARHELEDGEYFTWTLSQAREAIGDEALFRIARLHHGIEEDGDMDHDPTQNVLEVAATAEDIAEATDRSVEEIETMIEQARDRLRAARHDREPPLMDPTLYVDWNAMAIQGLMDLDRLHDAPEARTAAKAALDRILEVGWDPDRGACHAIGDQGPRVWGLLDDQAHLLAALIAAHQATGQARYLEHAVEVADHVLEHHVSDEGPFTTTADGDELERPADQPTASATATLLIELPRLARLTGTEAYRSTAETALVALHGETHRLDGVFGGTLHLANLLHLEPGPHTVITGQDDELLATARHACWPWATLLQADDPEATGVPEEARAAAKRFEDQQVAIVCRENACQVAEGPGELQALLTPPAINGEHRST